jgi:hypothetical protein
MFAGGWGGWRFKTETSWRKPIPSPLGTTHPGKSYPHQLHIKLSNAAALLLSHGPSSLWLYHLPDPSFENQDSVSQDSLHSEEAVEMKPDEEAGHSSPALYQERHPKGAGKVETKKKFDFAFRRTDKKWNKIVLIYKEIQSGAVAKSYMTKGFLIYEERCKYFPIYEDAVSHMWLCNCFILNFLVYEENWFFFISEVINIRAPPWFLTVTNYAICHQKV